MLGPSFRAQTSIHKALRKVRTIAGVKFFGAPIGTPITPGMVKTARAAHGDKKTDTMLVSQRRNTRRDGRRSHFQNQADVRAKKRVERVEGNAARRDAQTRDKEVREIMDRRAAAPKAALQTPKSTPVQNPAAPKAAQPSKVQSTNTQMDRLFDLVHAQGKWDDKQVAEAITLAMKLKATADPMVRQLLMALVKRLQKEED